MSHLLLSYCISLQFFTHTTTILFLESLQSQQKVPVYKVVKISEGETFKLLRNVYHLMYKKYIHNFKGYFKF